MATAGITAIMEAMLSTIRMVAGRLTIATPPAIPIDRVTIGAIQVREFMTTTTRRATTAASGAACPLSSRGITTNLTDRCTVRLPTRIRFDARTFRGL